MTMSAENRAGEGRNAGGITQPPIDELVALAGSKYQLVIWAAKRARQINAYYGHLGDGSGTVIPPQVTSKARKPLSIAFEELAADKIVATTPVADDLLAEEPAGA